MTRAEALAFRAKLDAIIDSMGDDDAVENTVLFPTWAAGRSYAADERVQYGGLLYKCVQAHTSQEDWTPDATPALWTRVSTEEWPEWVQPTGAQDAYKIGDRVKHQGARWISTVDDNVWEPGVYGWIEAV